MTDKREVAYLVLGTLGIGERVKSLVMEEVDSPWDEKALIKRKKGFLDVKFTIWREDLFLLGRMYHIFLYISDVLNSAFKYDPSITPDEEKEAAVRNVYNQVWSIYVDSRIERMGVENFYNRLVRRNLFVDLATGLPVDESDRLFSELWERTAFTYPEIIEYSRSLAARDCGGEGGSPKPWADCPVTVRDATVRGLLDGISSPGLSALANDLINYTAYACKDCFIAPSHFGVSVFYQRRIFLEIIPTSDGRLIITIFDAFSNAYTTRTLREGADAAEVQDAIRESYRKIAAH